MVILSADDWVCIFVLFVVSMRHPAQGATGGCVMQGLLFKRFPLGEFPLFVVFFFNLKFFSFEYMAEW